MSATVLELTPAEILNYIPQQKPFRFIDHIISLDEQQICGCYTFQPSEFFYSGHFPHKPITPGVILLECMSQIGVVAFGIYLLSRSVPAEEISNWLTMFTDAKVEFINSVYPGDKVTVTAKKKFWRKMKLNAEIEMYNQDNQLVATAIASGIGVAK